MDQFQSRDGASDAFGAIGGDDVDRVDVDRAIGRSVSILRRFSRGKVANRHRLRFFEHEESLRVPRNAEGFTRQSKFACCNLLASQCDVFFMRFFCVCQYVL